VPTRKERAADRRGHEGKQEHATEKEALDHLHSLVRRGAWNVSAYRCAICHNWHVGHHNPKGKRRKKRR
jgi:lipopolysaccharide biosynthesis regulator YciM